MQEEAKVHWLVIALVVVLVVFGLYVVMTREAKTSAINDYDECANAGYPVTLSYPSTCRTPDGRIFTQEVPPMEGPGL